MSDLITSREALGGFPKLLLFLSSTVSIMPHYWSICLRFARGFYTVIMRLRFITTHTLAIDQWIRNQSNRTRKDLGSTGGIKRWAFFTPNLSSHLDEHYKSLELHAEQRLTRNVP